MLGSLNVIKVIIVEPVCLTSQMPISAFVHSSWEAVSVAQSPKIMAVRAA